MQHLRGLAATVVLLAAAAPARPGTAVEFRLEQAVQGRQPTTVLTYLEVWDAEAAPVAELDPASVSGTLGGQALAVGRVVPFRDAGEGVGYIFCVDISRSLTAADFAEIRNALGRWIDALGPRDRAAVLTFGDQSRIVLDFTADTGALRASLDALAPTDMTTVLYRGLRDALELSSRRDPELPGRRVLVILSDGKDEGSGLAAEDVMVAVRERGVPIYAIGFGGPARQESLELLQRFATNSGGRFVAVGGGDFEAAYGAMRDAVDRVWLAELDCAGCQADGAAKRLQVNLRLADRVLSEGIDLRLLPPLEPVATAAIPVPAAAAQPAGDAGFPPGIELSLPPWVLLASLGGLVVIVGGALAARRARSRAAADADGDASAPKRRPREKLTRRERKQLDIPIDSEPLVAPVAVCLTVVRGSRAGVEHRFLLHRRGVLGSGGKSDFVVGEPELAAEQVELVQEHGRVLARNLSRSQPTLLNGVPLADTKPVASGDLLGNRGFIARVRLG
jgi:von Willebrand factor type A domain